MSWEKKYLKAKGRYFGLTFEDDVITISVLPSVADIEQEGVAMHHCVFNAGYYKRDDCLILSARDKKGNRIETIEVSLKTFSVVQSRAKFNKTSDFHQRILTLMAQNMNQIRALALSNQ